jgi:hypothetical protein
VPLAMTKGAMSTMSTFPAPDGRDSALMARVMLLLSTDVLLLPRLTLAALTATPEPSPMAIHEVGCEGRDSDK